jgi:hypothetical protein
MLKIGDEEMDITLQMCFTVGGEQGKSPAPPSCMGVVRVLQAQSSDLGVCAGTWLCVQHEKDGANACTCADESI